MRFWHTVGAPTAGGATLTSTSCVWMLIRSSYASATVTTGSITVSAVLVINAGSVALFTTSITAAVIHILPRTLTRALPSHASSRSPGTSVVDTSNFNLGCLHVVRSTAMSSGTVAVPSSGLSTVDSKW